MVRKLSNKGITLIELIVSFALVGVAIIYFYQTLYTVKKLYSESQKETKEFVNVNYAYRIIDELNKTCNQESCKLCDDRFNNYKDKDENFLASECTETNENGFKKITFKINEKYYSMYFYENMYNNYENTLETDILNLITDSNDNGINLEEFIMSSSQIDTGLLEEYEIDDNTTKPVWCLNEVTDARKLLKCSAGQISYDWCASLNLDNNMANKILQVASGTRDDKYCIFKINGSYKLITTDNDLNTN